MALIEKEFIPPKKEQFHIRLDPELMQMLDRYCIFIDSSQNYVVEEALRYMFSKDRDFQNWLTSQGTTGDGGGAAAPQANNRSIS